MSRFSFGRRPARDERSSGDELRRALPSGWRETRQSQPRGVLTRPHCVAAALLFAFAVTPAIRAEIDFERAIAPVIIQRCLECHNAKDASGGLVLGSADGLKAGGDGGPVIVVAKPDDSSLYQRIAAGEMPPPRQGNSRKLPDAEIRAVRQWIEEGAKWPAGRSLDLYERTTDARAGRDWWSLQPVVRPSVPSVASTDRRATAVDAFILARLEKEGLSLAPPAERTALLRRLAIDLTGLPPTAEQLEEFASDPAPDAHQRQVDRLLASPHFGERWGRYWLDLARFAETCGYERDQEKPQAWRYRDWVVRMLNADLPYDRFALEQIAGDELPQRSEDQVVATGFLRVGTWNDEPNDPQEYKYERLEDMVNVTMTSFLGLTVKCARCHDHKFDPVPQADYYRVANAFWAGPIEPRGRELLGGPTKDELGFDVLGWTDLTSSPPPLRMLKKGDPTRPGEAVAPGQLTLFASLARPVAPPPEGAKTTHRRRQLAEWIVDPANPLTPRVTVNRLWLHHFGQGLVRSVNNFGFQGERPTHPQLLDWLASELVRREWRVKSLHRELVSSSVYRQSSLHPRHVEFAERDFANSLWWRAERRRLDAESLRDALLAASGQLDLRMGGPSFKPTISADALEGLSRKSGAWQASPRREQQRRSLYTYSQRSLLSPLMTVFDFADTTLPCGQRDVSTVAPQALALLNNEFAHQQSEMLARRVIGTHGGGGVSRNSTAASTAATPPEAPGAQATPDETARRARLAWRLALGRDPSAAEVAAAVRHVDRQRSHFQAKLADDSSDVGQRGKNADGIKDSPTTKNSNALNTADPKNSAASAAASEFAKNPPLSRSLALHLDARRGVTADAAGKLQRWADLSERGRHATQDDVARRPELVESTGTADGKARPAIRFDGQRRFLALAGQVVASQQFTVIAVVNDRGPPGHRELISNWNGAAGNSVTSAFVGLTGESAVRLSDDLSGVGQIVERGKAFLLTAVAGSQDAVVLQNERVVAKKGGPLSPRNLSTGWVVGQQGNIDGEYWNGDLFELLVFDRELTEPERLSVSRELAKRHGLALSAEAPQVASPADPELLAWASLCHVLLNSNEFIYVD